MTCDLCNSAIGEMPHSLLSTKEVVTSKHCWILYLNGLIADGVLTVQQIREGGLPALVGQMASSDTPWALCGNCTDSLRTAGFPFRTNSSPLPHHGHALCRSSFPNGLEFVVLDDDGMAKALLAAKAAALETLPGNIGTPGSDPSRIDPAAATSPAMSTLPRKQTHWRHGRTCFDHPPLDDFVGLADGLFPLKSIVDPDVGEEVVLWLRDQTPFMEELRLIRPFRLKLKVGMDQNEFGPLCFFVFWIPIPADPDQAFAAYDLYLNPHCETHLALWRELASQSHWHLFLIGDGNQQREFFEFENTFNLHDTLDFMVEACSPIQLVDFNRAKDKFMQENSVVDLLKLQ